MQLLIAEGFNHTHKHGPNCGHTAIRHEGHCARISLPVSTIDAILGPPHMDAAAIKLDHVPGQFAEFAGA
jgi:hypothetical protein